MWLPLAFVALALAGCASNPSLHSTGTPARVLTTSTGIDVQLSDDSAPSETSLEVAPDRAWAALVEVYQELGIPLATLDQPNRMLGNQKLEVRRRLGGQSLSSYLDCGGNLTGNIADNYRVQLSVLSRLSPGPSGGSLLQTRINASARATEGTSGNWVNCGSTGRLESRIGSMLRQRTAG